MSWYRNSFFINWHNLLAQTCTALRDMDFKPHPWDFCAFVLLVLDIPLTYTGKHYFTAVSPVLEGPSYRLLAAGPFWSKRYVSDHSLRFPHSQLRVKQLFHYSPSVNVGIILGLTLSKSLWYFFHFASLSLLFWLNSANGKPSQTTSQGHSVPINIIKVFLGSLHIAFLIFAETYCCEIQCSSRALDSQTGVKLAGNPLKISHSQLSLAPHL